MANFALLSSGLRCRGQLEEKFVSSPRTGADADPAAQPGDDALDGGEAEPVPRRALLMQPRKRDEDAAAFLLGQRLSVVPYQETHTRSLARAAEFNAGR